MPRLHTDDDGSLRGAADRTLRVAVIDDDAGIRTLTRMFLEAHEDIALVAESAGGDAIEVVERERPDVVLLDLLMPDVDGRQLLPHLVREHPNTMVLILSALSAVDEAEGTFASGAFAYLEKSVVGPGLPDQLLDLHALFLRALSGETVWSPAEAARIRR